MPTRSNPMVSWTSMAWAMATLVPTPSVEVASTGWSHGRRACWRRTARRTRPGRPAPRAGGSCRPTPSSGRPRGHRPRCRLRLPRTRSPRSPVHPLTYERRGSRRLRASEPVLPADGRTTSEARPAGVGEQEDRGSRGAMTAAAPRQRRVREGHKIRAGRGHRPRRTDGRRGQAVVIDGVAPSDATSSRTFWPSRSLSGSSTG